MVRKIQLTQGLEATVDDIDYDELSKHKWLALKRDHTHYAARGVWNGKNNNLVLMHREIAKTPTGKITDHINGDGLDNRRSNLRTCNSSQNCWNQRKVRHNLSSKYKGVSWHKKGKKWRAYISLNKVRTELGLFENEIDAAKAYDSKAKELFGQFAQLNFPE